MRGQPEQRLGDGLGRHGPVALGQHAAIAQRGGHGFGGDHARVDAVGAQALLAQLAVDAARQADQPGLGRPIGKTPAALVCRQRRVVLAGARADVDDLPAALLQQVRQQPSTRVKRCQQIALQVRSIIVLQVEQQRVHLAVLVNGVVDQQVDAPVMRQHGIQR